MTHVHEFDERVFEIVPNDPEHMKLCPTRVYCWCGAYIIPAARTESGKPEMYRDRTEIKTTTERLDQ